MGTLTNGKLSDVMSTLFKVSKVPWFPLRDSLHEATTVLKNMKRQAYMEFSCKGTTHEKQPPDKEAQREALHILASHISREGNV